MIIQSHAYPMEIDNIDTDQIIPAKFLKITHKTGLGKSLFHNWRYCANGKTRADFILNDSNRVGGQILIAGNNFGCGSSREHASWALGDFGIKAIISSKFAEIFRNNALQNKILPVELPAIKVKQLLDFSECNPRGIITLDLNKQEVTVENYSFMETFEMDSFRKDCLMQGIDETQFLINLRTTIYEFELKGCKNM